MPRLFLGFELKTYPDRFAPACLNSRLVSPQLFAARRPVYSRKVIDEVVRLCLRETPSCSLWEQSGINFVIWERAH